MKQVFSLRANTLALALALSFAIGMPGYNQAEAKSPWNPMNWIPSGNDSEKAAAEASKQAEAAEQAANRAMLEAQKAMEKASEAKRKAEALQAETTPEKPVVVAPATANSQPETTEPATEQNAARMELSPNPEAASTQKVYQEAASQTASSNETSKPEPWNPLNWFKKSETAPVEQASTSAPTQEAPAEAVQEKAPATTAETQSEPANAPKGSNWNPMNWFGSSASQVAASAEPVKEPEATPKAQAAEVAEKNQAAVIETEKGNIAIELYPDQAPQTVANFTKLVNQGFYNRFNMKFHRVVPGFVIQTGDPTGTGAGGSKETIPLEAKNKLSHNAKGVVAMARGQDPNSATSQFYITLAPQTSLDGKYAVFGKVISGFDILDKIEKDDMMYGIKIVDVNSITREPAPDKRNFFSSLVPH